MATIKHIDMLYLTQPQIKGYTIEAWGIIIYHNVQAHFPHGKYSKKTVWPSVHGIQNRSLDRILQIFLQIN